MQQNLVHHPYYCLKSCFMIKPKNTTSIDNNTCQVEYVAWHTRIFKTHDGDERLLKPCRWMKVGGAEPRHRRPCHCQQMLSRLPE